MGLIYFQNRKVGIVTGVSTGAVGIGNEL